MVPEARYNGGFADISEYCQFDWYQYVWYIDPKQEKHLARWIGVAKNDFLGLAEVRHSRSAFVRHSSYGRRKGQRWSSRTYESPGRWHKR